MHGDPMKNGIIALMACILFQGSPLAAQEVDPVSASEECTECHDEIYEVLSLTVHDNEHAVACVSCHGLGEEHIEDPLIENIGSGKGLEGMEACITCHEADIHETRPRRNQHASAQVFCNDCHAVHSEPRPKASLLKADQTELCLSCHVETAAIMSKPFNHKLDHGGMDCASCHDPHGGKGRASFTHKRGAQETCVDCHADKRGPFVFEHVSGIAGDCMSCHEAHGSSNPAQLTRASVSQLCIECHSTQPAGLLGSQPVSTHDLRLPRYQNCTTCHTAIHGSSRSPLLLK